MFGKAKGMDQLESVVSAPKPPGTVQSPPPENQTANTAPSLFGSDCTMEGNLSSDGEIQFDGKIKGNIRAAKLVIGKDAHVFGEIMANTVIVQGKIRGVIRARKVEIIASGFVEGDVIHAELSVEGGAYFMGNCQRLDDPFGNAANKPASGDAKELQTSLEKELSASTTPAGNGASSGAAKPAEAKKEQTDTPLKTGTSGRY